MSRAERERSLADNWRAYRQQMEQLIDDVEDQIAAARIARRQRAAAAVRIVRKTKFDALVERPSRTVYKENPDALVSGPRLIYR